MAEYIDKSALYEKIAQLEELAGNRYFETPSNSPCYSRYMAQFNERTAFKHIIADFPSADVAPVRRGRWEFLGPNRLIGDCMCGTCSVCKVRCKYIVNKNICPNCGAKMNEEATDNG